MKLTVLSFLIAFHFNVVGQINQGVIRYEGRITHYFDQNEFCLEIPEEQQKINSAAVIYFDSTNIKLDLLATIVYSSVIIHEKEKDWLLYLHRDGSERYAYTLRYNDIKGTIFDSITHNHDTVKVIAGYTCHLTKYRLGELEYEAWSTNEIELGSNLLPIPDEIAGACLEFTLRFRKVNAKFTATSVDFTKPDTVLYKMVIPAEYFLEDAPLFPVIQTKQTPVLNQELPPGIPPPPPPKIRKNE